jgi:large subunit ribosomal protein L6
MSRIGKNPVDVPSGVDVKIDGAVISAKGSKGEQSVAIVDEVTVAMEDNKINVTPRDQSQRARSMWGLQRSLVSNLIEGVSTGFTRNLEINGVGYRASVQGQTLNLQLGFSHDVKYPIPEGITVACATPTQISISGADKQKVGQIAAEIRGFRPPEPYKGKGVKYAEETIFRKEGKKK